MTEGTKRTSWSYQGLVQAIPSLCSLGILHELHQHAHAQVLALREINI